MSFSSFKQGVLEEKSSEFSSFWVFELGFFSKLGSRNFKKFFLGKKYCSESLKFNLNSKTL